MILLKTSRTKEKSLLMFRAVCSKSMWFQLLDYNKWFLVESEVKGSYDRYSKLPIWICHHKILAFIPFPLFNIWLNTSHVLNLRAKILGNVASASPQSAKENAEGGNSAELTKAIQHKGLGSAENGSQIAKKKLTNLKQRSTCT